MKDYYSVLGLTPSVEDVVIKAAYRALAQRYHPDRFPGDPALAQSKMEELNEAYRVLSDPGMRQAHDRELLGELAYLSGNFAEWVHAFVKARRHGD